MDLYFVFFVLTELTENPPEGIVAGPVDESNFFEWEAFIMSAFDYFHTNVISFWGAIIIDGFFFNFIPGGQMAPRSRAEYLSRA